MPKINVVVIPNKVSTGTLINSIIELHNMLNAAGVKQTRRVLQIPREYLNYLPIENFSATVSEVVIVSSGKTLEMRGQTK